MYKNIFIMGPGRAGKTTLSKMLNKKYRYSIISIDDIVTSMEVFDIGIYWEGNHLLTAKKMAPFLTKYLKELSEGNKFYDGCKTVIEGTDIDFEELIPNIDRNKYLLIGLTYNTRTKEDMFNIIRKYDTKDDWSYYLDDDKLREYCDHYMMINKFFDEKFREYGIKTFDTSKDRDQVLEEAIKYIEVEYGKKDTSKTKGISR